MGCEPTYNIANMADFEWSSLIPRAVGTGRLCRLSSMAFKVYEPTRSIASISESVSLTRRGIKMRDRCKRSTGEIRN